MSKDLQISFGVLCEPKESQIRYQKLKLDKKQVSVFQKQADAIILLRVHGILIDSHATKCQDKLFKKILNQVDNWNK